MRSRPEEVPRRRSDVALSPGRTAIQFELKGNGIDAGRPRRAAAAENGGRAPEPGTWAGPDAASERTSRGAGELPMLQGSRNQGHALSFTDWLLPRTCSLCGEAEGVLHDPCVDCERSLEALQHRAACPRCAAPVAPRPDGPALGTCSGCRAHPPPFDRVVAPWIFAPPLSSLIHRMKYHRDLAAAAALGRMLAREVIARPEFAMPDAVLGMPVSRRRLLLRGFNHAEELAAIVRGALGLRRPRGVHVVRRHTPPQARSPSVAERHANVAGAFAVRRWPSALRRVAIVDDVLTTGATASALAATLRTRGVDRIDVWCCARTPPS